MTTEEAIKSALLALVGEYPSSVSVEQNGPRINWQTLQLNGMDPQEWVNSNLRGQTIWCTGEGIVEAVEILVNRAIENDFDGLRETTWYPPSNKPKEWGQSGPFW